MKIEKVNWEVIHTNLNEEIENLVVKELPCGTKSQSSGLSESLYPSTMKLETLLSSSCSSHDKRAVGYVDEKFIPTNSKYVFVKVGENESLSSSKFQANSSQPQTRKQKCHCCSKIRHEAKNCHRKMVDQRDEFDPNWVSKGVRDLPGNIQSATSNVPSGRSLMYFGILLATGVFFVFIAFTMFLPVMVLMPQKFALCFTIGCSFIIGSFFALKGPKNQLAHMSTKERLPFTLGFIGSMVGTIYVSMVLHSYILSVLFSVLQVLALAYYAISYFPGGSAGLKFLSSALTSSILKCFGR
ncbi:Protein transport protein SFT2 [Vitis vinifera]|uniref:Vesicle transport protein n=1 Tax=Vitis vinifera TaxID=29760 RepID=A0A438K0U2_VITVI|nr:Protein transport protein SFT2 [Vitis vinifera]